MKDCAYFEQLCSNSVDGTLTDGERIELEEHLQTCASCRAVMDDLLGIHDLLAEPVEMPDTMHESIMQHIEKETKKAVVQPEKPMRRMPVFTMVAAAAVVVMVVLSGGIGEFFATGNSSSASEATAAATSAGVDISPSAKTSEGEMASEAAAAEYSTSASDSAAAGENGETAVFPGPGATASDENVLPALPESIHGLTVASCYLATNGMTSPAIEGNLLANEGGFAYYAVENNLTVIEKQLDSLENAGYHVQQYEDVNLVIDTKEKTTLLIVQQPS